MLTKCPECELPVSDKALTCPHCGYPIAKPATYRRPKKSHMRLPNGFGQISEIRNRNLRNPWRVMVTVGKDENGKPISRMLKPKAYFKTYNDAYAALVEYNRNPYDLEDSIRMNELYERWTAEHFKEYKSDSSIRTITAAWAYCSSLYKMRVKEVRTRHIKACIEEGVANINGEIKHPSAGTKSRIKSLMNMLFDYAVEYELTDKNYSRTFELGENINNEIERTRSSHMSFTDDELKTLMHNRGIPNVDLVLAQIFTGLRPQELGLIEVSKVNINEYYFIGGMKTDAGTDRIIPIHSFVYSIFVEAYADALKQHRDYLFSDESGKKLTYDKYKTRFNKVIKGLKLNEEHRPHDPRKQFVTMAKKYKLDEYAIKRIVGHEIGDITESVYTDRGIEWLKEEIEKIKPL